MDLEDAFTIGNLFSDQLDGPMYNDDLMYKEVYEINSRNIALPSTIPLECDYDMFPSLNPLQDIPPVTEDSRDSGDSEKKVLEEEGEEHSKPVIPESAQFSIPPKPDERISYSNSIGIPSEYTTLLTVLIITPEDDPWMQYLCEGVELYLANQYIFCRICIYSKNEYPIALQSTSCDLCIVYKEQMQSVSMSFPTLYCAEYLYNPIKVIYCMQLRNRMTIHIIKPSLVL